MSEDQKSSASKALESQMQEGQEKEAYHFASEYDDKQNPARSTMRTRDMKLQYKAKEKILKF